MFIKVGENEQAARLFCFLMLGEQLAKDCAASQAKQMSNKSMRRFLNSQAKQENYHRIIFQRSMMMLTPKGSNCDAVKKPMLEYKGLLDEAIESNNFAETLLGQQVILEGLGEIVLENIDKGMTNRKFGFKKIRHLILSQEHAHHNFGLRKLDDLANGNEKIRSQLSLRTQDYMHLVQQMLTSLQDLFDYFKYDSSQYFNELNSKLPIWLNDSR